MDINILEFIKESESNNTYKVEILAIANSKAERKRIVLVMPCELELTIYSELSQNLIEFKICNSKILSESYLLIDKDNPFIKFKHDKYNFVEGNLIIRVSGIFKNTAIDTGAIENNGVLREWHKNGMLYLEYEMSNGIKNGLCRKWYSDGDIMQSYNYYKGKLHGNQKKWYLNGKLKAEWNYRDDILHGISYEWNDNGSVKSVKEFKDGILITSS
tara:strand:- start:265 stop:909 length:645 start_codon:yes stop_codon:yes gene_type:complete